MDGSLEKEKKNSLEGSGCVLRLVQVRRVSPKPMFNEWVGRLGPIIIYEDDDDS